MDPKENIIFSTGDQSRTWSFICFISIIIIVGVIMLCIRMWRFGQKMLNPKERRQHVGTRARQSFSQPDPIIFVSTANLPPPPKYEAMAPPGYEEVVGNLYPNYPASIQTQPITQPIAMAQNPAYNATSNVNNKPTTIVTVTADEGRTSVNNATSNVNNEPTTIVTVTADERRTSVTVDTSP